MAVVNKENPSLLQFPEVRVVEASAGSGKTYSLAKRYVQLLLNPQLIDQKLPIRNILALTFTNKAAFEMKARILFFLKTLAIGQMSNVQQKDILSVVDTPPSLAKEKAYQVMEDLIHHYNFFQVQTIDKFINALLSGCAFKLGLTANFKIKTNSFEYLEYSLDQLIDQSQYDKDLQATFDYFLNNYLYIENRSGWFVKKDILMIVYALFSQHHTYALDLQESPYSPEDFIKLKKTILSDIKKLSEDLPEGTHAGFQKSLTKFVDEHVYGFDIDHISDYFAREDFPVKKGSEISDQQYKLWDSIHSNLIQLCEMEAFSLFNPYIHIYKCIEKVFTHISTKDDVLFLEQLNKKARMLFDNDYITVEELYYRLATRFQHYLIDEFQDTSRLQWQNIEQMAEEALSTGGSLFYVGDRKQAIYGFRGGDVSLFDDIQSDFQSFNVVREPLVKNWRSQKAIVDFNNALFSPQNIESFLESKEEFEKGKRKKNAVLFSQEDVNYLESIFQTSQQSYDDAHQQGYVRIEHVDTNHKEERDEIVREKVINLIRDLKERYEYGDIAILTRGNKEVERITQWLLAENISIESERTSNIKENHLIQELLAFLRFLNSPIDNVAFAEFLVSDLFHNVSNIPQQEMHDFIFSLRERIYAEKDFYIYVEFRKAYPEIWEKFINEFYRNIGLYPLYELTISIYDRFEFLNNFPNDQAFFMHFLELIKKQEEEYPDVDAFLDYFENMKGENCFVYMTNSNAIRILTIHKSKGLEFPVVIIPFLSMDIQVGSQVGELQQQSYVLNAYEDKMRLLRLKSKYYAFSDKLYEIYAHEYKKAFLSELNNIYVALTRPRNELYAFYSNKVGNSHNYVKFLIPEDMYEIGRPMLSADSEEVQAKKNFLPASQYYDWMEYLKEEFCTFDNIKRQKSLFRGEVLHYILSFVHNLDVQDNEQLFKDVEQEIHFHYRNTEDLDSYIEHIKNLLKEEDLKFLFYCGENQVLTEQDFVNSFGHTKRIDRLIIKKDEVIIVDFKTSKENQKESVKQVEEYKKIIGEIYSDKKISGYLVFFDDFSVMSV